MCCASILTWPDWLKMLLLIAFTELMLTTAVLGFNFLMGLWLIN